MNKASRHIHASHGFTLIEVLISLTVMSLSGVLIMQFLTRSNQVANQSLDMTIATYLAQDLRDEVLSKAFRDPQTVGQSGDVDFDHIGLETNNASVGLDDVDGDGTVSRENWDDVDDYDGFQTDTYASAPFMPIYGVNMATGTTELMRFDGSSYDTDGDGAADFTTPDLSKYIRAVSVQFVDNDDYTNLMGTTPSETKLVTITVFWPDNTARPVNTTTLEYTTTADPQGVRMRMVTLTGVKTNFEE